MNNLLYRRQFILSNKKATGFENWKNLKLQNPDQTFFLYHHPDLQISTDKNKFFDLVLLGYILDPENPSFNDQSILKELAKRNSFDLLVKDLDRYNGRFVLIISSKASLRIINDTTGFREVFYTFKNDLFACGSTPNIIAQTYDIEKTDDIDILSFYSSEAYKKNDYTWLGYKTLYKNILHLPPNHFIDTVEKKIDRFWPREPLEFIGIDECAEKCAKILKGTIASALNRYNLHMGVTGGWDTRLILSATKDFKNKIFFFVNKPTNFTKNHKDIRIPKKLAKKAGFQS